jgi:hypothetical protein
MTININTTTQPSNLVSVDAASEILISVDGDNPQTVIVTETQTNIGISVPTQSPIATVTAVTVGPQGIQGAQGENANMQAVNHGSDANLSRPDFDVVFWVGSVEPVNAIDGDVWLDF